MMIHFKNQMETCWQENQTSFCSKLKSQSLVIVHLTKKGSNLTLSEQKNYLTNIQLTPWFSSQILDAKMYDMDAERSDYNFKI